MNLDTVLDVLFPQGRQVKVDGWRVAGMTTVDSKTCGGPRHDGEA